MDSQSRFSYFPPYAVSISRTLAYFMGYYIACVSLPLHLKMVEDAAGLSVGQSGLGVSEIWAVKNDNWGGEMDRGIPIIIDFDTTVVKQDQ